MLHSLLTFILHWCLLTVLLWLASKVFHGIEFKSSGSLWLSALLLGFANAVIRPFFIFFTLPLTLLTFGFFLLVINALMLLLVSTLVPGFKVSGFWTAFFASLFISALSLLIDIATSTGVSTVVPAPHAPGTMVEARAQVFVGLHGYPVDFHAQLRRISVGKGPALEDANRLDTERTSDVWLGLSEMNIRISRQEKSTL